LDSTRELSFLTSRPKIGLKQKYRDKKYSKLLFQNEKILLFLHKKTIFQISAMLKKHLLGLRPHSGRIWSPQFDQDVGILSHSACGINRFGFEVFVLCIDDGSVPSKDAGWDSDLNFETACP
jgi:hypothetical protein